MKHFAYSWKVRKLKLFSTKSLFILNARVVIDLLYMFCYTVTRHKHKITNYDVYGIGGVTQLLSGLIFGRMRGIVPVRHRAAMARPLHVAARAMGPKLPCMNGPSLSNRSNRISSIEAGK